MHRDAATLIEATRGVLPTGSLGACAIFTAAVPVVVSVVVVVIVPVSTGCDPPV
jgi:hypothetical protein